MPVEVVKMWLDRVVDDLTLSPFSTKGWSRWLFKVRTNLLCSTVLWPKSCRHVHSGLCVTMVLAQLPTGEVTPAVQFGGEWADVPGRCCLPAILHRNRMEGLVPSRGSVGISVPPPWPEDHVLRTMCWGPCDSSLAGSFLEIWSSWTSLWVGGGNVSCVLFSTEVVPWKECISWETSKSNNCKSEEQQALEARIDKKFGLWWWHLQDWWED